MISDPKYKRKQTKVDLTFDQTVTITESHYPPPSFTRLLVDLGGSLGLWLGVGIVQLFLHVFSLLKILRSFTN